MKAKKFFGEAYLAVILCFLYLPIVLIIVFSFSGNDKFAFINGFTLKSYIDIFTSADAGKLAGALKNTLIIAAISSVLSTVLGTFSAIGIFYLNKRTKKAALSVNQLPMTNSEVVMAVSLMLFFSFIVPAATRNIFSDYVVLILSHISFCTPYVVLSVMPRLAQMNPNLYEAALDLGASPIKALLKVIVPFVSPGVISGFVMAFTLSMDDFIITQINKGDNGLETLSTYIYEDIGKNGMEPFWFAVFSIIFVVVLTLLLIANNKKLNNKSSEGK